MAKRADQRSSIFDTSFAMANDYEKMVSEMLMRVKLQRNDCGFRCGTLDRCRNES